MSGKKTDITEEAAVKKQRSTERKISTKAAPKQSAKKSDVKSSTEKPSAQKQKSRPSQKTEKSVPVKKSEPKGSAAEKSKTRSAADKPKSRSSEKSDKQPDISSKTPQVMRLVEQKLDMVNPTILAGKSSIPRKLRGLEPLSRIMKREAEGIIDTDEEAVTYNVTALVIDDHAAEILQRFNACDCEICVEQLSRLAADCVPARFAKLRKSAVERNSPEIRELKEPLKRKVTSQMIRLVMQNKKRSYHDM